jgi:hypothetical protein
VAVLLEELRSQMKVVTEAVQDCATKAELRSQMEVVTEAIHACATKTDLEAFKSEFSMFRAEVRGDFEAMNARFDVLTAEVARKAEGAALDALERRVTALEHRAGS